MHYGAIKDCDIANGPGVRVSLFVSGCTNHCKNCFQPETWAFDYGSPFTRETEAQILALLGKDYIKGLTVLGGEPFEPSNQEALLPFLERVKARFPDKNIWVYTGFTYEELTSDGSYPRCAFTDFVLRYIDVLVDGRFIEEQKNPGLQFRGSENQRIIDIKRTTETASIVLWKDKTNPKKV